MTPDDLRDALGKPWVHGKHFEGGGLRFATPVILDGLTLCSFDLSGAIFEQGLSARGTVFRGMSWLKGAQVHGALDLREAVMRHDLRLDGVTVETLRLSGARAEGVIDLDDAQLGGLHLDRCICLANVSLGRTDISGALDLSQSDLMGGVWAQDARFGRIESEGLLIEGRTVDFQH